MFGNVSKLVDRNILLLLIVNVNIIFEINTINNKLIFLDYVYVLLLFKGKVLLFFRVMVKLVK